MYSFQDLKERTKELNKGGIILSFQYGMVFLLNKDGEIILNITPLVDKMEALKHS